jgi:hypothetical protein
MTLSVDVGRVVRRKGAVEAPMSTGLAEVVIAFQSSINMIGISIPQTALQRRSGP